MPIAVRIRRRARARSPCRETRTPSAARARSVDRSTASEAAIQCGVGPATYRAAATPCRRQPAAAATAALQLAQLPPRRVRHPLGAPRRIGDDVDVYLRERVVPLR